MDLQQNRTLRPGHRCIVVYQPLRSGLLKLPRETAGKTEAVHCRCSGSTDQLISVEARMAHQSISSLGCAVVKASQGIRLLGPACVTRQCLEVDGEPPRPPQRVCTHMAGISVYIAYNSAFHHHISAVQGQSQPYYVCRRPMFVPFAHYSYRRIF